MLKICITCVLAFVSLVHGDAQHKLEFSGYTKNLLSAIHVLDAGTSCDNLIHNRSAIVWNIDTTWTIRTDLRTRLFFGKQVQSSQFDDLVEEAANDVLDLSIGTRIGDQGYFHSYFDRLYVQYVKNKLEVRLGRQRINWGISTLWNPNDIFNAYSFTDFDYEERPGSDGVSIRYYSGELSSIELVAKAGPKEQLNMEAGDGAIAALWRTHLATYDFQILGGYLTQSKNIVLGGGWAGNLKNWGFKGEGSVFIPLEKEDQIGASVSIGWDYVFRSGVFIGFGGLYNALGRTSGGLEELFAFELSARNLYPFRWTVNATAAVSVHPLVSGSLTAVYSVASSHPVFISPAFTWSAKQNLDLDLVGQFVLNKSDSKYLSPVQAGFLRVKWSY
ncbi:MAG TPA: hypothetical protein VI603_14930 [Saprospiraceae bacterium]|nr:hypothetical protein [Saprospiraceae bacterium]